MFSFGLSYQLNLTYTICHWLNIWQRWRPFQFRFNKYIISDINQSTEMEIIQFRFNKYIASNIKSFNREGVEQHIWTGSREDKGKNHVHLNFAWSPASKDIRALHAPRHSCSPTVETTPVPPSQSLGVLYFPLSPPSRKGATHSPDSIPSFPSRLHGLATTLFQLR